MSQALPDLRTAPQFVQNEMINLRAELDAQIPPKRDIKRNILIATWNIREFGRLTETWDPAGSNKVKRNWRGLHVIAEIVSRFDVIAVQEIGSNLGALRTLIKTLGPNWDFLLTDINQGDPGDNERLGFLFDTRRIRLSGLAGELTAPDDVKVLNQLSPGERFRQFARTPYAVSFRAGHDTFILVTTHVIYGDTADDRVGELTAISNWLASWASRTNRFHHNLLLLGDFNIDRHGDKNYEAFVSTGLEVPKELHQVPRTIFKSTRDKFYDQIAWFRSRRRRKLSLQYISAGGFDFSNIVYQSNPKLTRTQLSFRVSDHLPLWVEFGASTPIE